jgi:hypothetical protein
VLRLSGWLALLARSDRSRAAGLAMAFNLIESAHARWRAVNAPHLVALVRAGARFEQSRGLPAGRDSTLSQRIKSSLLYSIHRRY